ncbi:uncharacterized protein LOC124368908 [Homalodisca vitripennis]|uniref:uncharacterized protein LOC124368908 n=1 Tax=Homalodisca vitripennis TaxID=197043 RepID=UPI001EEA0815|nr:uncharacterized protein LOC124368908 [Homalodisca vitripennis]XP_046682392.1 uncharacterized protein LOC124368908 [Homalodisca vitripennis]
MDAQEIIPFVQGDFRLDRAYNAVTKFNNTEVRALLEGQFISKRAHAKDMGFVIGKDTRVHVTGRESSNIHILQVLADCFKTNVYSLVCIMDAQEIIPFVQGDFRWDRAYNAVTKFNNTEVRALLEGQFISKRAHAKDMGLVIGKDTRVHVTGRESSNIHILQVLADCFKTNVYSLVCIMDAQEIIPFVQGDFRWDRAYNAVTKFNNTEVRALLEGQFISKRAHAKDMGLVIGKDTRVHVTGRESSNIHILQVLADCFKTNVYSLVCIMDAQEIIPFVQGDFRWDRAYNAVTKFNNTEVRALLEGQFISKRAHAKDMGLVIGKDTRVHVTGRESSNIHILQVLADCFKTNVYSLVCIMDAQEIISFVQGDFRWDRAYNAVTKFNNTEVPALLEGQFISKRAHAKDMGLVIGKDTRVHVTGRESSNIHILQVLADCFKTNVYSLESANSAVLGAAYQAKHGLLHGTGSNITKCLPQPALACSPYTDADQVYRPMMERYCKFIQEIQKSI